MKLFIPVILALVLTETAGACQQPAAESGDWPWWRGPSSNGIAEAGQKIPTKWSETENVVWKAKIPGRGHSSPTVVGNRIFLATADEQAQIQGVLAFGRKTGEQLWQTEISRGGFPKIHPKNTHATCTVAADGERLFVVFHHHAKLTLAALDYDGKKLWAEEIGPFNPKIYEYGYAASPILYGETVIVAADYEKKGFLTAYDRASGKNVWTQQRPPMLSFSSPVIANVADRDQLLISGCGLVSSFDPKTGRELWSVEGTTMATCGTMVWDGDLVIASGGYPKSESLAVKADGSRAIAWKNKQKCYEQSLLAYDGYVYGITDAGIAFCWRAADGQEMWKQRVKSPVSASPVLIGDTIMQTVEDGTTYVFKADPTAFKLIAENRLGNEAFATLAVAGDRLYARVANRASGARQEYLYCIGAE